MSRYSRASPVSWARSTLGGIEGYCVAVFTGLAADAEEADIIDVDIARRLQAPRPTHLLLGAPARGLTPADSHAPRRQPPVEGQQQGCHLAEQVPGALRLVARLAVGPRPRPPPTPPEPSSAPSQAQSARTFGLAESAGGQSSPLHRSAVPQKRGRRKRTSDTAGRGDHEASWG